MSFEMLFYCPYCRYYKDGQCTQLKIAVKQTDTCPLFNNTPNEICRFCQKPLLPINSILIADNDKYIQICQSCYQQFYHTCHTCEYNEKCGFQLDTSGKPKIVMQTIQQGPMVMQQQVKNPELVNQYCPNCQCYCSTENIGCLKDDNVGVNCANYTLKQALLQ